MITDDADTLGRTLVLWVGRCLRARRLSAPEAVRCLRATGLPLHLAEEVVVRQAGLYERQCTDHVGRVGDAVRRAQERTAALAAEVRQAIGAAAVAR